MSSQAPAREETAANWPNFRLRYTFNPDELDAPVRFDPDELVVFDPAGPNEGAWLSAERDSYIAIEDVR